MREHSSSPSAADPEVILCEWDEIGPSLAHSALSDGIRPETGTGCLMCRHLPQSRAACERAAAEHAPRRLSPTAHSPLAS